MKAELVAQLETLQRKIHAKNISETEIQKTKNDIEIIQAKLQKYERELESARKWRAKNPEYFTKYYKTHKDKMIESIRKYKKTPKGKATEQRYESKPETKQRRKLYRLKRAI